MSDLLSVTEAAKELGISGRRVHALISDGRLPAEKIGSQYVIKKADLEKVKKRPVGRPPKVKD
jgi:excisionase family DNA binding protein